MRLFIFALIVLFPISSFAGEEFFPSDWWSDDWWEQEETVIEQNPPPQQNIQQQKSIESLQERLDRLKRLLEEKEKRRPPSGYIQRKK